MCGGVWPWDLLIAAGSTFWCYTGLPEFDAVSLDIICEGILTVCVCVFLPPLRHTETKKLSLSFLKDTTALEWHRLLSRLPTIIGYSSVFFSRTATNLPHSASYKMAFQQLVPFIPYRVVCINKLIENENSNLFPEFYCIGIGKRLLNYNSNFNVRKQN